MNFKFKRLLLEHFKGSATKVELIFNGKVTYLVGVNGRGKSMTGKAFDFMFKGKKMFSSKYRSRMISDGSSKLKVTGELHSEETGKSFTISRTLTNNDNSTVTIKGAEGIAVDMSDVLDMVDLIALRPFDLINKSPVEQSKLIGVDTSPYDKKIKDSQEDLKPYRKSLKFAKVELDKYDKDTIEKVEPVSLKDLYDELEEIRAFNNEQNEVRKKIAQEKHNLETLEIISSELEEELEQIKKRIKKNKDSIIKQRNLLSNIESPKNPRDTVETNRKIEDADAINEKAEEYTKYIKAKKAVKDADLDFKENELNVANAKLDKIKYIQSCDVGKAVSFDDDGGLLISAFKEKNAYLNEDFFSRGQIIQIATMFCVRKIKLAEAEGKDVIPFIFIDNAESLDENKLDYIERTAEVEDIQFILAYQPAINVDDRNTLILKEEMLAKNETK